MALLDDYQRDLLVKKPNKKSKYRSSRIHGHGRCWDSRAEYARWLQLSELEKAGGISGLEIKPKYTFRSGIRFYPDFRYTVSRTTVVVEDVKGDLNLNTAFRMKRDMLRDEFKKEIEIVQLTKKTVDFWIDTKGKLTEAKK